MSQTNMSSGNTPHPSVKHCADTVNARYIHGRPEHELVPSRYALRVGEIDVMVVSDGVLSLPGAMLGHNADPAVRAAWLEDMFLPPDVLEWALNVVVVRSGGRTILIDAGMGWSSGLAAGREVGPATGGRRHRSASVTDVVLTHMHMDHCWRAARRRGEDRLRPDLRIHLAAAEAEFWESPDFSRVSMPPGFPDALRRTAKRFLNEYHSQMRTFETEYEVAPGVVVQRTGGHTPGHSVVRLASGGDRLTFAGDAVFQSGSSTPTGTTASNTTPRRRPASGSVFCGSWRRTASRWWPLTCRSRPSAMWRSPATSFVGYRAPGSTDRLLGWGEPETARLGRPSPSGGMVALRRCRGAQADIKRAHPACRFMSTPPSIAFDRPNWHNLTIIRFNGKGLIWLTS
jgi:glyoxylase-like metal-dependent hydrolase (beta-lactamase superfamily II)